MRVNSLITIDVLCAGRGTFDVGRERDFAEVIQFIENIFAAGEVKSAMSVAVDFNDRGVDAGWSSGR